MPRRYGTFRKRRRGYRSRFGKRRKMGYGPYKPRSLYRRPMTAYKVRRLINPELKISQQLNELQVQPVTGNLVSITDPIVQGVLATQRNGQQIQPAVLHGHINLTGEEKTAATDLKVTVRMAFLRWKESQNDNPPSAAEIMSNTADPQGPYNFGGKGKFDIMWSRVTTIVNSPDNSQFSKRFRFYLKLGKGPMCQWNEATPEKYHLFFFAISDATVTDEPALVLSTVFRFTDS